MNITDESLGNRAKHTQPAKVCGNLIDLDERQVTAGSDSGDEKTLIPDSDYSDVEKGSATISTLDTGANDLPDPAPIFRLQKKFPAQSDSRGSPSVSPTSSFSDKSPSPPVSIYSSFSSDGSRKVTSSINVMTKGGVVVDAVLHRQRRALATHKSPHELALNKGAGDSQSSEADRPQPPLGPRQMAWLLPETTISLRGDNIEDVESLERAAAKLRWGAESGSFKLSPSHNEALLNHRDSFPYKHCAPEFPSYFRWGIRFIPLNGHHNLYRTVTISDLPKDIKIGGLLDKVRGGQVLEAKLLDTSPINESLTALVTFVLEKGAATFPKHASQNSLLLKTSMVSTPAWPIDPALRRDIFINGHRRCIQIRELPKTIPRAKMRHDLEQVFHDLMDDRHIARLERSDKKFVAIEFSSIQYASASVAKLKAMREYRDCSFLFIPDPCAQDWENAEVQTLAKAMKDSTLLPVEDKGSQDPSEQNLGW